MTPNNTPTGTNNSSAENASMAGASGSHQPATPSGGPAQKIDGSNPDGNEDTVIDEEIARETIENK